jgi:succinate-semialdehyde dehydrogenase / glutarate-semialdehyde dehydrogenase
VCANRVFVHRSIIEEFTRVLRTTQENLLVCGSVWDPKVNFGPLYSGKAVEKVKRHVDDAVSKGAKVITGGFIKKDLGPNFYVPTIVVDSKPQTMCFGHEETFGPVAPLVAFDTEEEVLQIANTYESGLAAYFYTENISRLWRVAEALETGMVGVQVGLISACEQPFGGIKESGIGREGSKFGVEDYVNIKSITVGI